MKKIKLFISIQVILLITFQVNTNGQQHTYFIPKYFIFTGETPTWGLSAIFYRGIQETVCEGDTITIMTCTAEYVGYPGLTASIGISSRDCFTYSPSITTCTSPILAQINALGVNILSVVPTILDGNMPTVIIKILAKKTSNYSINWQIRNTSNDYPSNVINEYFNHYSSSFTLNVQEKPPKPVFKIDEIVHPFFSDNSKTLQLTVNGCDGNNQVSWLRNEGGGKVYRIDDPYECKEYQVACVNQCHSIESDIIMPAGNFHPQNSGYSQIFLNHVAGQVGNADTKGEKFYRKQYQCILDRSIGQPWGQKFVKYNFDYMATHLQCSKSIDLDVNSDFYTTFGFLGRYHQKYELTPAFSSYAQSLNTCSDLDDWRTEHELFLNNAVFPCFDNLASSAELNLDEYLFVLSGKLTTAVSIRGIREWLVWGRKYRLNCGLFFPPETPNKEDLKSVEIENSNVLNVKAIIDTTFFIKTKNSLQLKVTKLLPNGSIIDLTSGNLGTNYSLSLDTSIVSISSNGFLTVKRTSLPYSNNRLPLLIKVENGNDIGYGQFAIYDTDNDSDYLADTYEEKEGLNPNIANPIELDTDQDGIEDFFELSFLTSPIKFDTDGDGYSDKLEMLKGTDANSSLSFPYQIYSIQSGLWNDPNSWSCGCIPSMTDPVVIKSGHIIELNTTMGMQECLKIETENGAIFNCTGKLKTLLK